MCTFSKKETKEKWKHTHFQMFAEYKADIECPQTVRQKKPKTFV